MLYAKITIFIDHRDLAYIYSPTVLVAELSNITAERLLR